MNNFNDIEHRPLRTYNRCALASNILEDAGREPLNEYLSQFSDEEKKEMHTMYGLIKTLGKKRVVEMVTHGLTFSDDEYVAEEVA